MLPHSHREAVHEQDNNYRRADEGCDLGVVEEVHGDEIPLLIPPAPTSLKMVVDRMLHSYWYMM